jgi:hypothetical protein
MRLRSYSKTVDSPGLSDAFYEYLAPPIYMDSTCQYTDNIYTLDFSLEC